MHQCLSTPFITTRFVKNTMYKGQFSPSRAFHSAKGKPLLVCPFFSPFLLHISLQPFHPCLGPFLSVVLLSPPLSCPLQSSTVPMLSYGWHSTCIGVVHGHRKVRLAQAQSAKHPSEPSTAEEAQSYIKPETCCAVPVSIAGPFLGQPPSASRVLSWLVPCLSRVTTTTMATTNNKPTNPTANNQTQNRKAYSSRRRCRRRRCCSCLCLTRSYCVHLFTTYI